MNEHKNARRAPLRPLDPPTLLLTTAGLGFLRPAPGTWGSLPPVAIAAVQGIAGYSTTAQALTAALFALVFSLACIALGGFAERRFGVKDAPEVVADETAGVALPVLLAVTHFAPGTPRFAALLGAFVLFRLFDIFKPWPVNRLERLPGGWGVLLDDLMAGVYAAALLLLAWFISGGAH